MAFFSSLMLLHAPAFCFLCLLIVYALNEALHHFVIMLLLLSINVYNGKEKNNFFSFLLASIHLQQLPLTLCYLSSIS
jgi:hypothetical protein